jgi:acyl-CoA synthetase (AMP-forming)/AMP-acid ligase II
VSDKSSCMVEPSRFIDLWREAFAHRSKQEVSVRVSSLRAEPIGATVYSLTAHTLQVIRALRGILQGKQVTRVAILANGGCDLIPLYHAWWLMGITVIAIPSVQHTKHIVAQLNNVNADLLVHGPEQTSRLSAILAQVHSIKYRIALGASGSGMLRGGEGITYLHELARPGKLSSSFSPEDFEARLFSQDTPALIVFTADDPIESRGIAFTEQALLKAAYIQAQLYPVQEDGTPQRVWFLMHDKTVVRLVHSLIMPLVHPVTIAEYAHTATWEMYADFVRTIKVSVVVADDGHLSVCAPVAPSPHFQILHVSHSPIPKERAQRYCRSIVPAYGRAELGGIVCVGKKQHLHFCDKGSALGLELLSCGNPLPGVQLNVVDQQGRTISNRKLGEVVVTSPQSMASYQGSRTGEVFMGPNNAVHTGDTGYWSFDEAGAPHLVITSGNSVVIERAGTPVHVAEVEASLYTIPGITGARVVAFPHRTYGREVAAFIVAKDDVEINREIIWQRLLRKFSWSHLPKVIFFGKESARLPLPSYASLLETLEAFESTEFPEGMRA